MGTLSRDYHGYTVDEALLDAEQMIARVRGSRTVTDVHFIVGNGVIKDRLMQMLKSYGLEVTVQLGNSGVLVCIIE